MAKAIKKDRWTVICPKCKHENHITRHFCEKCGTRIKGIVHPFSGDSRMKTAFKA